MGDRPQLDTRYKRQHQYRHTGTCLTKASPCGCCRDLKTSNVLLTAEGVAKISDVRVATGLLGEERLSDASPHTYGYASSRQPTGTTGPVTVSLQERIDRPSRP